MTTYIVQAGDTGEKIAERFTGTKNRWPELAAANPKLKDPVYGIRLFTGKTINLPDAWSSSTPAPAPVSAIEKKGLSTGAMFGLAAGGALAVGGLIYVATRKKSRRRSRRK